MEFRIIYIPPSEIPKVWESAKGYIEKAMPYGHGELTTDDIQALVLTGKEQLWMVVDGKYVPCGTIITEVINYPRKRVIRIVALSGEKLKEWLPVMEQVGTAWAKQIGATAFDYIGRKGWSRILGAKWKDMNHFMWEL